MNAKKHSSDGQHLNIIVVSTVAKALDIKKKSKAKSKNNSNLDNKLENFNIKNLDIR